MTAISNNQNKKPSKTTAFFICLLIAGLLWLINTLNSSYTQAISFNVNFINVPKNKIPLTKLPSVITLEIKSSGLKLLLMQLNNSKPITVDFNSLNANSSKTKFAISTGNLNITNSLAYNVTVTKIQPDTLLFIEPKGFQKNVVVKLKEQINCKNGYGYVIENINPEFITLYGNKDVLQSIDTVFTLPLIANNATDNINGNIDLIAPNNNITLSEKTINYAISVKKLIEKKVELPLSLINESNYKNISIFPNKVTITYTTLQNELIENDLEVFKAQVQVGKGNKHQVVLVTKPGSANIIKIEPAEVELVLVKK